MNHILGSDTVIPHHRLEEFLMSLSSYWANVHCVGYPHVMFGFCSRFFKKVLRRNGFYFVFCVYPASVVVEVVAVVALQSLLYWGFWL